MTNLPKRVYPMISFYADSRRGYVNDNTVLLIGQRLQTVFDDWTQNHNVRIGEQYIMGLNGHVLQVWFNQFRVGRKPSTINNYVSFVNPFLRWAYKIGYIPDDISGIIKVMHVPTPDELPPEERPVDKYMTHDDVNRLLTAVDNGDYALRNKAMIALILFSGVRVSELCSLKLKSVLDCPQGYLYCRRKGGRWCYVNVAEEFYPYLTEYLATRDDLDNRDAPLFTSKRGGALDRRTVYAALAPVQKSCGLATGPHALRHTFVSEIEKLAGPAVARDLANHKSIHITNRYTHSTNEQREDAVAKLSWNTPAIHKAKDLPKLPE